MAHSLIFPKTLSFKSLQEDTKRVNVTFRRRKEGKKCILTFPFLQLEEEVALLLLFTLLLKKEGKSNITVTITVFQKSSKKS